MVTTPTLKSFYTAIQGWIDAGAPETNIYRFDVGYGLCCNLFEYINVMCYERRGSVYTTLNLDLWYSFIEAGLDGIHPFNVGPDTERYVTEKNKYTNPKRLAWIKAQLAVV